MQLKAAMVIIIIDRYFFINRGMVVSEEKSLLKQILDIESKQCKYKLISVFLCSFFARPNLSFSFFGRPKGSLFFLCSAKERTKEKPPETISSAFLGARYTGP